MKIFNFVKLGRAVLLAVVFVIGVVCVSCGDKSAALVGRWENVSDEHGWDLELFKDGTGVFDEESISWKTEGKRFVLTKDKKTKVGNYNLSDYMFTVVFDEDTAIFVRKEKVEEYVKKREKEWEEKLERIKKDVASRFKKVISYFTDSRNGQKYRAVKIGGMIWMAENLNYPTGNSWCYDNDRSNCNQYGRLYDWSTAKTACPTGWHLPTRGEWDEMIGVVVDPDDAHLVSGWALNTEKGWVDECNGVDGYGFSALPGGERRHHKGEFNGVGNDGLWWTATREGDDYAYRMIIGYGNCHDVFDDKSNKKNGHAVRCVKDAELTGTTTAQKGTFTDNRDSQTYKTVKIGNQVWMAENLRFKMDDCPCYQNNADNCKKYGRLYDWNTAKEACPKGWHLPSNSEWIDLVTVIGSSTAGKKLKSTSGWNNQDDGSNGNGTDDFGFSALPGGRLFGGLLFEESGNFGVWWTATKASLGDAYFRVIGSNGDNVGELKGKNALSVRCVEDPSNVSSNLESPTRDGKLKTSSSVTINNNGETSNSAGSGDGGVGRKGGTGIGYGSGYGSGFGSGGGGVDDLLGGGTGTELKKKGELKVSSPDFLNGGALDGARSRASIQRVVMQNMAALRYAYNKRLREKPGIAGEIKVKFAIDEFGKVISAQIVGSTMDDSELETTVVSRVKSWNFEKIDKPGDVTTVTYPFVFSQ